MTKDSLLIPDLSHFQDVKEEAEIQGATQEQKLKQAGDELIYQLGDDSPAAAEVNKQVEEVDSVREDFVNDIAVKIEKVNLKFILPN